MTLSIWGGWKDGVIDSIVIFSSPSTVTEFIGEDIQSYQSRSQMDNQPNWAQSSSSPFHIQHIFKSIMQLVIRCIPRVTCDINRGIWLPGHYCNYDHRQLLLFYKENLMFLTCFQYKLYIIKYQGLVLVWCFSCKKTKMNTHTRWIQGKKLKLYGKLNDTQEVEFFFYRIFHLLIIYFLCFNRTKPFSCMCLYFKTKLNPSCSKDTFLCSSWVRWKFRILCCQKAAIISFIFCNALQLNEITY